MLLKLILILQYNINQSQINRDKNHYYYERRISKKKEWFNIFRFNKSKIIIILLSFSLLFLVIKFRESNNEPETLAGAAHKYNLLIGSAVSANYLDTDKMYKQLITDQLSIITTENEMKFDLIHPEKYQYDFTQSDKLVNFASENNQLIRGHTLIWHRRIPEWIISGDFSREEMKKILKEHIQTVVGKYRGEIYAWDVVNEAFNDNGSLRDSIWLRTIGPDYIALSFKWAHEADPKALLFYNDYNIEEVNKKSNAVYSMMKDFQETGIPIHGVGLQMHTSTRFKLDFNNIKRNINRFNELDIQSQITELDVVLDNNTRDKKHNTRKQIEIFSQSLDTCLNAKGCTAFIMWGITDKYSPRNEHDKPLVYDINYRPKKIYNALLETMKE